VELDITVCPPLLPPPTLDSDPLFFLLPLEGPELLFTISAVEWFFDPVTKLLNLPSEDDDEDERSLGNEGSSEASILPILLPPLNNKLDIPPPFSEFPGFDFSFGFFLEDSANLVGLSSVGDAIIAEAILHVYTHKTCVVKTTVNQS
jgi:hypothetical protein